MKNGIPIIELIILCREPIETVRNVKDDFVSGRTNFAMSYKSMKVWIRYIVNEIQKYNCVRKSLTCFCTGFLQFSTAENRFILKIIYFVI